MNYGNLYPKFIQDKIGMAKDLHTFGNVNPGVIIWWFLKVVIIVFLFKKMKEPKESKKIAKWIYNNTRKPENAKLNLIESSLYCFILIPTVIVLLFLIINPYR